MFLLPQNPYLSPASNVAPDGDDTDDDGGDWDGGDQSGEGQ